MNVDMGADLDVWVKVSIGAQGTWADVNLRESEKPGRSLDSLQWELGNHAGFGAEEVPSLEQAGVSLNSN